MKKLFIIIVALVVPFFLFRSLHADFFNSLNKTLNNKDVQTGLKIAKSLLSISEEDEIEIGRMAGGMLILKFGLYQDPVAVKYVNLIGKLLISRCERTNLKFHFNILNTDSVNAYACPGGFIFITKGALREAKNEDELAAVIAHEISHVTLKHELKEIRKSAVLKELSERFAEKNHEVIKQLSNFVVNTLLVKGRNRKDEFEADKHSLNYLRDHNYNPLLNSFLSRLVTDNSVSGKLSYLNSTHPPISERLNELDPISDFAGTPVDMRKMRFEFSIFNIK